MAFPGTKTPPTRPALGGNGHTQRVQSAGSKQVKVVETRFAAPDINKAPPSRIYTGDYTKVGRATGDVDRLTSVIGNPLGL